MSKASNIEIQKYIPSLTRMEFNKTSYDSAQSAFIESIKLAHKVAPDQEIYLSRRIDLEYFEAAIDYMIEAKIKYSFYESLEDVPDSAIIALQSPDAYGEFLQGLSCVEGYTYKASDLFASMVRDKNLFVIVLSLEPYSLVFPTKPVDYGAQIFCGSLFAEASMGGFLACYQTYTEESQESYEDIDEELKARLISQVKQLWLKTHALKEALSSYADYGLKVLTQNPLNQLCIELDFGQLIKSTSIDVDQLKKFFLKHARAIDSMKQNDLNQIYIMSVSNDIDIETMNIFIRDLEQELGLEAKTNGKIKEIVDIELLQDLEPAFEEKFEGLI